MPVKRLSLKLRRRRSRDGQPCGEGGTGGEFLRPPNRSSHKNSNANHGTNPKNQANCDQYNYEGCSPAQMGKSGTSSQEHQCIPQVIKTATTTSEHPPIPSEITVHRPNDAQNSSEQQPARTNGVPAEIITADCTYSTEAGDHASSSSSPKSSSSSTSSQSYKKPTVLYGHQDIVWSVTRRRTLPRDCRATRHWLHELDTSSGSGSSFGHDGQDDLDDLSDEMMLAEVFDLPLEKAAKPPPPTYDECVHLGLFGEGKAAAAQDQDPQQQQQQQQAAAAKPATSAKAPLREEIDDIVASLSLDAAPTSSSAAAAPTGAPTTVGGSLYPRLGSMRSVGSK